MLRTCSRCGVEKPLQDFRFKARTGRYSQACADCWTNVPAQTKHIHASMQNMLRNRWLVARNRRTLRQFTVTFEEVLAIYEQQDGRCAITGIELTHEYNNYSNASIDRIDVDRGYEADNIRLVCAVVNSMRNRLTDDQLIHWCGAVVEGMSGGNRAGSPQATV